MAVNLSPAGGVAAQFFTNTGSVLTGGKLYIYAAGTTTPAVTYTTSSGSTPWTNPVVLDAAGRVPNSGEIWLTNGVAYKFVLKDSNDVLIATYDNIVGINDDSAVLAALANTSDNTLGDALIGFKQSQPSGFLTNAVARTVNAKLQEIVSVLDFGADPTGDTDSTIAIQRAINALPTLSYGLNGLVPGQFGFATLPALYFPKGLYKINNQITFGAYTKIVSDAGAVIYQTDNTKNIFYSDSIYQNQIVGLTFIGGLNHIYAQNGPTGVTGQEGANVEITNCTFMLAQAYAIQIKASGAGGGYTAIINNPQLYNNKRSVYADNDWVKINDGWVGCYPQSGITHPWDNDTAQFVNASSQMTFDNMIFIPGDSTFNTVGNTNRWIDAYNSVVCVNCRFGGEYAGLPIVYSFMNLRDTTTYPWLYGQIVIQDSLIPCGGSVRTDSGVIVAKTGLPASIRIEGCNYLADNAYIRDLIPGGMAGYISAYRTDSRRPYLSITLNSNNTNSGPIASTTSASQSLLAFVNWTSYTQANGNYNQAQLASALGPVYTPTGTISSTKFVIDTGITKNVLLGYATGGIWDVHVIGNPNAGATDQYLAPVIGQLIVTGEFIAGQVQQKINYQDTYNPTSTFTVTAAFANPPSGYASNVLSSNTTASIAFFVDGFTNTAVDSCILRLTRRG